MKRRYLRKPIQNVLVGINIAIGSFFCMLHDFELEALPILFLLLLTFLINALILIKWGKNI